MIRRLRIKFVCINMTIVTIMLCVIFGTILHFTSAGLERESLRLLRSVALETVQPGAPGQGAGLPYFSVQLDGGEELTVFGGGYYDLSDEALLRELVTLSSSAEKSGVLREYDLRFLRVVTPGRERVVFADISSEVSTMENLLRSCLLIGAASFFAFLLISILLARWAVKPVAAAWERQRRFVADASHELKTPLTVILSNAQLLAASGEDARLRDKLTADLVTVAEQMKTLVARLLDAARIDQGAETMTFSTLDWSDTAARALLPFDCVFYERGLTLESAIDEGITVRGSPAHLTQVVDILLDNAQKYSAAGGKTTVTLRRNGKRHCLLTVENEGAALSQQELRHIFERFYRADAARERTGSYGLGLSIAEGIVRAHGGKIWAESREGVNRFLVQLPTVKQE